MIFQPGRNLWRLERASRAAVILDAADYFLAVRQSLLKAQRRVFIVGWDIHSQTRLVGRTGKADDGYPRLFGDFLTALTKKRPDLEISLLLWDYAMLYAVERELFPTYTFRWNTPRGVRFCLDDAIPIGCSQHQKFIVVDDAIAFCGGLDVTIRRWDTSAHAIDNPRRVDPWGKRYPPFHDVQMLVDGEAAKALGELARARWAMAACEDPGQPGSFGDTRADPWPASVKPDLTDVDVGIARTCPCLGDQAEVREVAVLFEDAVDAAERTIYIENQFLTCVPLARRIAQRMCERAELQTLIVVPHDHEAWLESQAMRHGRICFMNVLREAGVADRVRLVSPHVSDGKRSVATMVHSKIMIVDDRLLRVGSANLNNRSMGTDAECDLAVEAKTDAERTAISRVRNRLLADHCGVTASDVEAAFAQSPSLLDVAERLSGNGHRLLPTDDKPGGFEDLAIYLQSIADPERPIGAEQFVSQMLGGAVPVRHASTIMKVCAAALVVLLLALAWHFTPIASLADPRTVREALAFVAQAWWGPIAVIGLFIAGGLVLFPVTVLIAATAATFGPLSGFIYAGTGAMVSAVLTFLIGAALGKESLRDVLGPRLNRIRERVKRKGVLAVAVIRLVPIAPFSLVNIAAGASDIRFTDFLLGTLIGIAPGLIVMTLLGHELSQLVTHPSATQLALLAGAVLAWIGASIGVQMLVSRFEDAD